MPFGLWAWIGPGNRVRWGFRSLHRKGQFWGKGSPVVRDRDFLPWAVQKQLNRSICHLGCGLGWAEWTHSIVFARWGQCTQFQSYSPGGANVPDGTLPSAVQKWLNRSIYHFGCGLGWAEGSTSSIIFTRWRQCAHVGGHIWHHLANTIEPPVCGGNAVLCKIILTTCYCYY